MTFTEVDKRKVQKRHRIPYRVETVVNQFMQMNVEAVKVNFSEYEYKDVYSAYSSLYKAVKRLKLPIDVRISKGEVYLIRNDM